MSLFGVGIPETIFILLLMLILLGPNGVAKSARGLARLIRKVVRSPIWNDFVKAQQDIKEMPTKLLREAGIEEFKDQVNQMDRQIRQDLKTPPITLPATPEEENLLPPDIRARLEPVAFNAAGEPLHYDPDAPVEQEPPIVDGPDLENKDTGDEPVEIVKKQPASGKDSAAQE